MMTAGGSKAAESPTFNVAFLKIQSESSVVQQSNIQHRRKRIVNNRLISRKGISYRSGTRGAKGMI